MVDVPLQKQTITFRKSKFIVILWLYYFYLFRGRYTRFKSCSSYYEIARNNLLQIICPIQIGCLMGVFMLGGRNYLFANMRLMPILRQIYPWKLLKTYHLPISLPRCWDQTNIFPGQHLLLDWQLPKGSSCYLVVLLRRIAGRSAE